ncbi:MAG: nickel pincer cofactor biosynthesis protein LarC [Streptosporangiales bacterium]|nr:nickel pincer cofactor biosynthesis protein LarC [Streptosporangiales bacterium]
MMLGALVDAGVPLEVLQDAVDAVGVEPVELTAERVSRHGLAATRVHVRAAESGVTRTWDDVRALLDAAALDAGVRDRAHDAFARLARAEAASHGIPVDRVHFHEVGALDSIADVVGASAGLHALALDRVVVSPVPLGSGVTRGMHGGIPLPAPAALAVLGEAGAPVFGGDVPLERTTPTGAALLAAAAHDWGPLPPMRVDRVGVGAGGRDPREVPNVLRLVVGTPARPGDGVASTDLLLAANVDDLDPRLWPTVLARLLDAGAADAWLTPILMKKGRPAHTVTALVAAGHADAVRRAIYEETSTIGVRETSVRKGALDRQVHEVDVDGATVRVKVAVLDGAVVNVQPEYDDVVAAADRLRRPVKTVLAAAQAAAHRFGGTRDDLR